MTRSYTHLVLIGTFGGALLVGCTEQTSGLPQVAGATESSSERPREIRLDGIDPCSLVPESDFAKYYFEDAGEVQQNKTFKSPECFYGTNVGAFNVTLVVTEGIKAWTDGGRNIDLADAEPVAGFPAVTLISRVDRRACDVVVDVADDQYLRAGVAVGSNAASKVPEKCDYAHELAESAMKGLTGA